MISWNDTNLDIKNTISAFYGRFDGIEKVQYLLLQKAKKNRKFPKQVPLWDLLWESTFFSVCRRVIRHADTPLRNPAGGIMAVFADRLSVPLFQQSNRHIIDVGAGGAGHDQAAGLF